MQRRKGPAVVSSRFFCGDTVQPETERADWTAIFFTVCSPKSSKPTASVWREYPGHATCVAAVGGAFFLCSDALLALDRFSAPIPVASVWVLATYWVAQWCIARSVSARERS